MIKEIKDIVAAFEKAMKEGKETALATVVHVEGSSYRKAGARMLIEDDGTITGAISGGCLEGDALRKALLVIAQKKARLVTYNTDDEDDAQFGLGLGCKGIIHVLIEPIDPAEKNHPVQLLKEYSKQQKAVLVTLFSLNDVFRYQGGTCFLLNGQEEKLGCIKDETLKETIEKEAASVLSTKQSKAINYITGTTDTTVFFEYLTPPISLVIAGAGNDAFPLITIGELLGWNITVIDGRPEYLSSKRFSGGCSLVLTKPEKALSNIEIDERTTFVLMTHNYYYDLAMLRQLLPLNIPYVGVLGPKKKLERMLDELREEGITIYPGQLSKVYGPVGIDIGAETPEEIAVSVIAEINTVMTGRQGSFLKDKKETIHPRSSQEIEQVVMTNTEQQKTNA